jgi:hypothetical protein
MDQFPGMIHRMIDSSSDLKMIDYVMDLLTPHYVPNRLSEGLADFQS